MHLFKIVKKIGIPKEEIKLLSHHYSAGLLSYILPSNDKKDEIIRRFIDKIHGKLTLDNVKVPEILNGQDLYNEKVIGNENNNFKITKKSILRKSTKFFKKPLQLTNINQQLEISINIDQFKELFNCGFNF
ncbi:hypothetical protein RclHR1_25150001 [Rhizophagus clarus]|uniref:Uncharacterized protein n=1 Tax=Rhizophagus clarus TaxID=94130 RepID=A0A2Z6QYZ3_9GLOM|nr:hypothetical protein RclHR1_25150001 [Rhizophagus clarus]